MKLEAGPPVAQPQQVMMPPQPQFVPQPMMVPPTAPPTGGQAFPQFSGSGNSVHQTAYAPPGMAMVGAASVVPQPAHLPGSGTPSPMQSPPGSSNSVHQAMMSPMTNSGTTTSVYGSSAYTYSANTSPPTSGASYVVVANPQGGMTRINPQFLYNLSTDEPKKKKKKKKKKKTDKVVLTKEEQEEMRNKAQDELDSLVVPDAGMEVDHVTQTYLKDKGPKQVIINFLPVDLSEEELRALFEQYGPIECARFVTDKATGVSKGYGFVYYYWSAHARAAIAGMNGFELYGKFLRVSYAVPQRPSTANDNTATDRTERTHDHTATEMTMTATEVTNDSISSTGSATAPAHEDSDDDSDEEEEE